MATQEGPQRSASVGQSKATGGTKGTTGSIRRVPLGSKVTEARATAQRAKLDAQAEARNDQAASTARNTKRKPLGGKKEQQRLLTNRRTNTTIGRAIDDYLLDHMGGNSSDKTLEWHRTALGLMRIYFEGERGISLVGEIDAPDINAWFAHMRTSPGGHGKPRAERTIQTYARSARAFFHWLVRRETIDSNPFDRVTFPKVGKPLIQTIDADEFARLLLACTPPNETGPIAERAAVRNRAILWVLYDTGIRVSELCGLRVGDCDRRHGILTVTGKGSKERRIAMGNNCMRNLSYYLDKYRPDEEELAEWGSAGEDHLFLSETRLPLTKNGVTLLFKRIRERAGMTGKRISPHIFRHSFAIRYLVLGNDPFSLQELLGHEDMTTVKNYMHMNDETIQSQKRKYSPGDHLPTRIPGPKETRRRGYRARGQNVKKREQ
jgi:site-specific recombinase XerD